MPKRSVNRFSQEENKRKLGTENPIKSIHWSVQKYHYRSDKK